jgi:hypothetical protein
MAKEKSLVDRQPGVTYPDYVPFADVVRQHLGGNVAARARHIDGLGGKMNLTSNPELERIPMRFVGNITEPDALLIHEDDVARCVRWFRWYDNRCG